MSVKSNSSIPPESVYDSIGVNEKFEPTLLAEKAQGNSNPAVQVVGGNISGNCSTTDEIASDYMPGCFEGPEKTMEVVFRLDKGPSEGLKLLTREQLDHLCEKAKCTIVHKIANQHIDAYILSESSLFIYKRRLIMKTCGTTTLLRCLSTLFEYTDALGMELSYVGYSRKNLLFPSAQLWPHSSFGDEIRYLSTHEKLQDRLRGTGHVLGPITGDHWFVYVADHAPNYNLRNGALAHSGQSSVLPKPVAAAPASPGDNATPPAIPVPPLLSSSKALSSNIGSCQNLSSMSSNERTINMMMFDMAPDVAKIFYQSRNNFTAKDMTLKSGIHHLCPGAQIDEMAFTPCGYSMNAILHDAYSTIHITPEPECSYVSFETNTMLDNYSPMVRNVLTVFKPQRFVMTMFGDQESINQLKTLPSDAQSIMVPGLGNYFRTSLSSTQVDIELGCLMAVYSLDMSSSPANVTVSPNGVPADLRRKDLNASPSALSVGSNGGSEGEDVGLSLSEKGDKKERSGTWC